MKKLLSPLQRKEIMLGKLKELAAKEATDPLKLTDMLYELLQVHKVFLEKLDEVKHTIDQRVGPPGPQGKPGTKGDNTPVKGVDYFTPWELNQIVDYIESRIKAPENGKPGETPIKGVHYMTPADKADFARLVVKLAAEDENLQAVIISPEKLSQAIEKLAHSKKLKMEHITGLAETIRAFSSQIGAKGYLHGGGDTLRAGSNITLTRNADGTTTVTAASIGGTAVTEIPTGTINGVNKIFTISHTPTSGTFFLFLNGQYQAGSGIDYALVGTTITFVTAPVIEYAGLPFYAQYDY